MIGLITYLLLTYTAGQAPPPAPEKLKVDPEFLAWGARPPAGDPVKDPEAWNFRGRYAYGWIKSLQADGLTLYVPAGKVLFMRHDPKTGQQLSVREETSTALRPKKFMLGPELASGGYLKPDVAEDTYRIRDLCVEDRVKIVYDRRNGIDICRTISIVRRYGGRIPPAPGQKPDDFRKYHEQMNADQDWEVFRIPYPREYWPAYLAQDGKTYPTPYPQESSQFIPDPPKPPAKPAGKPRTKS